MSESPAPPATPASPPRRGTIIAVAVVAIAFVLGVRWSDEPRHRRGVLFQAPIRLVAGTVVSGAFLPEHEGPITLGVRFPRSGEARFDQLAALIGGRWGQAKTSPMGLSALYSDSGAEHPVIRLTWARKS